jgi:hypothetical protein
MVDPHGRVVSKVCRKELNKISAAYQKETGAGVEQNESEDEDDGEERPEGRRGKQKKEKLVNFNFTAKMSNIMTTLKGYCLDSRFEELLNTNRDALPLVNGVILLQSGELVPHHPKVGFLGAKASLGGGTKTLLIGLAFWRACNLFALLFFYLVSFSAWRKMQAQLDSVSRFPRESSLTG